jgi:hypothetical protein
VMAQGVCRDCRNPLQLRSCMIRLLLHSGLVQH